MVGFVFYSTLLFTVQIWFHAKTPINNKVCSVSFYVMENIMKLYISYIE